MMPAFQPAIRRLEARHHLKPLLHTFRYFGECYAVN